MHDKRKKISFLSKSKEANLQRALLERAQKEREVEKVWGHDEWQSHK